MTTSTNNNTNITNNKTNNITNNTTNHSEKSFRASVGSYMQQVDNYDYHYY